MSHILTLLNTYKSLPDSEWQKHLLGTLLKHKSDETDIESENRIHLIVSRDFRTRVVYSQTDFKSFTSELSSPHELSVCLTFELVHKLVFDFDCIGCKNAQKSESEECHSTYSVNQLFQHIENVIKRILHIDNLGNVIITQGKTHGIHVIFNDINVDRCIYHYICDAMGKELDSHRSSENSKIHLDQGCTSFVLPFGRNHTTVFRYISKEEPIRKLDVVDAFSLSPIPTQVFPFYSLKYIFGTDDGGNSSNIESCEYLTRLNDSEIKDLQARNLSYLKSFFRLNDRYYVYDEKSFAEYKRDLHNTIVPWRLVIPQQTCCMWLFQEFAMNKTTNRPVRPSQPVNINTAELHRFQYFNCNADKENASNGFVDTDVIEDCAVIKVMSGSFTRLNNNKITTNRKYVLIENLEHVRNVIYCEDIIQKDIWDMILVEYFDAEIDGNQFVIAVIAYITGKEGFGHKDYTGDEKIWIMQQIIKCSLTFDCFTGVLNDIYGTYKKIVTKITDTYIETAMDVDVVTTTSLDKNENIGSFKFKGNRVDNSKYDKITAKNFNVFTFCASLIYHHKHFIPPRAMRYYLYYYNYINEDTLNKILSEFVDCNIMISLILQTACARFCKDEKISLTTPAEMFKVVFKDLCYDADTNASEDDEDDDEDDDDYIDEAMNRMIDDSFSFNNQTPNRKRKGNQNDYGKRKKKRPRKKKVVSRDLIKCLKNNFWRPFTLNGIPYMYNGNEYENASSTYKMVCDVLKCTQSTFMDIFNARKFEQQHGRNFLYKTNFYYSEIKAPAIFNIVLKIKETTCGGTNSLLQRTYLNTEGLLRSDVNVYDAVVDGLNALNDLDDDLHNSSFRFILTQPVVPLKVEEDVKVKQFLEKKEYGFIALNVQDYNRCVNILDNLKNQQTIEHILTAVFSTDVNKCPDWLSCFLTINSLIQVLLVCVINTVNINEDSLNVRDILHALFGTDGAVQVGWNAFESEATKENNNSVVSTETPLPENTNLVPMVKEHINYEESQRCEKRYALKNVVNIETRIRWIFSRVKNDRFRTESVDMQNPNIKSMVYSLSEQFSKTFVDKRKNNNTDDEQYNQELEFKYNPEKWKNLRTEARLTDKTQKTQMRYKMELLTIASTVQKKFLQLVGYFDSDDNIAFIRKYAVENVKSNLPFRIKLISFLITVHFLKRLPKWTLRDIPHYKHVMKNKINNDVNIIPDKMLRMMKDSRFDIIRWLYHIAEKYTPFDFFTGFNNEYRDNILKQYILNHGKKYQRAAALLQESEQTKYESILLTLTYLYCISSFDVETLVLLLKLILSIEFPGQWLKLCVVMCGHRHAGKSKLLDILTEYSKSSATFKEPSESNKENQPGFLLYVSNMLLSQDEIATFANTFKKIISESKIDFRNNMGNVFASIYALSKLWYTCNSLPRCPYDSAVLDRILHFMVDFWHEEITNPEVAQFRYFTNTERRKIYEYALETKGDFCSKQILKNEGSLPFMFLQKETKIFIASMINENAIKMGLYYISMFFSWFCFVKNIHKPVNIDIKNLPSLPNKWRQQWLTQTNLYYKWKDDVKISVQNNNGTKIPTDLIMASFRKRAGNDYTIFRQLLNSFEEEFGRYLNANDNTYSISVDVKKLI